MPVLDRSQSSGRLSAPRPAVQAVATDLLALVIAAGLAACGGTGGTPAAGSGASATGTGTGGSTPSATTGPPTKSAGSPGVTVTPAPATGSPAGGAVYLIGPRDAGKTVVMHVGDRLQVTLTGSRLLPGWTLIAYPQAILRLDVRRAALGQYRFVATAAGQGRMIFVQSGCGGLYKRPCVDQMGAAVPSAPVQPVPTAQVFVLYVQVR